MTVNSLLHKWFMFLAMLSRMAVQIDVVSYRHSSPDRQLASKPAKAQCKEATPAWLCGLKIDLSTDGVEKQGGQPLQVSTGQLQA